MSDSFIPPTISCPSTDFISEKEYERLKVLNDDASKDKTINEEGKPKDEIELKLQIHRDTKEERLMWYRPYTTHDEWFRCYKYLKDPPKSYIRIDLKKEEDEWNIYIYYHRHKNPNSDIGGDKPIEIRHFKESAIIKALVKKIEYQIEEKEKNTPLFAQEDRSTWD